MADPIQTEPGKSADGKTGWYDRLVARLSMALALGGCAVLALMMYIISADVVMRYVFSRPIIGSVEIIYCLMGLLIAMGFGLVTYENGHVRVDILTSILPRRAQAVCDVIAQFLSLVTAGLLCWRLALHAIDQTRDLNESQVLALPVWLIALIMAVCSMMLVLVFLLHFYRAVFSLINQSSQNLTQG